MEGKARQGGIGLNRRWAVLLLAGALACSVPASHAEGMSAEEARAALLRGGPDSAVRNELLIEDVRALAETLPKKHINPFTRITREAFVRETEAICQAVPNCENIEIFTRMGRLIASIGDAHTNMSYWDGYSYPFGVEWMDGQLLVVNADKAYEAMLHGRITAVQGVPVETVVEQLKTLIPAENESWKHAMLPQYLRAPVYLYGLGLIPDETATEITYAPKDPALPEQTVTVRVLPYGQEPDWCLPFETDPMLGWYAECYAYRWMEAERALVFSYNACAEDPEKPFAAFSADLFAQLAEGGAERLIIDLRSNSGGNSEVLNPFTQALSSYCKAHPDLKVFVLVGKRTFSSGMFAIERIQKAAPNACYIGEGTGGALESFGEVRSFTLPNSQIPVQYSAKRFAHTASLRDVNIGEACFLPDVFVVQTVEAYRKDKDLAMEAALSHLGR